MNRNAQKYSYAEISEIYRALSAHNTTTLQLLNLSIN